MPRLGRRLLQAVRSAQLDPLPIRHHWSDYRWSHCRADWRAGVNVALLAFPQGMAYAAIAGLPIQYGIYGSAVAAMLGPLVSGSRFVVLGPTNATAVMVFASFLAIGVTSPEVKLGLLPLITLMTGLFLIIGAFLRVANLIQYVSRTVVTGYITAAAIFIIVNQMPQVLGYPVFEFDDGGTFFGLLAQSVRRLPSLHLPTLLLSLGTAAGYLLLQRRWPTWPTVALTLLLSSLAGVGLNHFLEAHPDWGRPVAMLRSIDAVDWRLTLPAWSWESVNDTVNVALVIAFLSILEGTSIGKSLAAKAGERLDANQEMLGMGVANLGCALYQGVPASGSLTRSQLNYDSGAATAWASVICGLLVAIGAYLLGPLTGYIPRSALGVVVIAIGLSLINRRVIRVVLKATRSDAIVFVTTFVAALLVRLDSAIILGTATSILLFLRKAAVPELVEYAPDAEGRLTPLEGARAEPSISIVHVEGDLFFGAADLFRDQMRRVAEDPNLRILILKMRNAHHLDATSVLALEELVRHLRHQHRHLMVCEARKDAIRIFRNAGLIDVIGRENIFPDNLQNPTLSTARALKRARTLLGGQVASVSIYVGEKRTPRG